MTTDVFMAIRTANMLQEWKCLRNGPFQSLGITQPQIIDAANHSIQEAAKEISYFVRSRGGTDEREFERIIQAVCEKAYQQGRTDREREIYGLKDKPHTSEDTRRLDCASLHHVSGEGCPDIKGILLELAGNVLEYKAAPKWLTELAQNAIKQAEKPAHASEEERKVMQPCPSNQSSNMNTDAPQMGSKAAPTFDPKGAAHVIGKKP